MALAPVEKVRFAALKRHITSVIAHPWVGRALGWIFHDRIPSRGIRIDTSGDVAPRIKAYLFWGLYESAEIRFVERFLRTDLDVIEAGASLGVVSCHIARKLRKTGRRFICVEANPQLPERIRRNLKLNRVEEAAQVVHAAISYDAAPAAAFHLSANSLASSLRSVAGTVDHVQVPAITLSALLDTLEIDEYVLVCDIEGAEASMFLHDGQALAKCRQMVVELHSTEVGSITLSVEQLISICVERLGFRLRIRRGSVCVFDK